jgi:hypothetical protein
MPRPVSTAFDKNLKVLLEAMLQPHKYRHSFPVHRNDPISALTLLPGLKKTCSPCRTRTARGAETDRPDLVEPPQLLATPGRHPSRPHPHHRKAPGAKPQATQPANVGKKEHPQAQPDQRKRRYKHPRALCKRFSTNPAKGRRNTTHPTQKYGDQRPFFEGEGMGTNVDRDRACLPPKALFTFGRRNQRDHFSPG